MTRAPMLAAVAFAFLAAPYVASAETIVDVWAKVESPAAPAVAAVTVAKAKTAFLILDIEEATCNEKARPRCVASVPAIAAFLAKARASGLPIAYSTTPRGTPDTILPPVRPQAGEPVVKASVDKFLGTDLEAVLKGKSVDTVIVCGTAAHGAVLFTATAAAQRQMNIVLPVDCLSAEDLFSEKAATWVLMSGPATRQRIKPTTLANITIE